MTEERLAKHKLALEAYLKKWVRTTDFAEALHDLAIVYLSDSEKEPVLCSEAVSDYPDFERFIRNLEEGFPGMVRRLAAEKKIKLIEIIDFTGIGRSTFYRILSGETEPTKDHCVEIALALRLNYTQAEELLESAGYTLSRASTRDMALRYFFVNRIYSIANVNELLLYKHMTLLGNVIAS